MTVFIFSVQLPQDADGFAPVALWAANGKDDLDATRALQQKLAPGFKIIESKGEATGHLSERLDLQPGGACELSSGPKKKQSV